jgi:anti-sigma factor RsiW
MYMKTFEEKFTAWLDGSLSAEESLAFENEHPSLLEDRRNLLKLRSLLKENFVRPELSHPDFFNAQIMARIEHETDRRRRRGRSWLGLPRLAWGGIASLAAGVALFVVLIPHGDLSNPGKRYVAQVLKAKTADPKVKATVDSQKDMTIIELEGLQNLPADKDLNR